MESSNIFCVNEILIPFISNTISLFQEHEKMKYYSISFHRKGSYFDNLVEEEMLPLLTTVFNDTLQKVTLRKRNILGEKECTHLLSYTNNLKAIHDKKYKVNVFKMLRRS